MLSTKIKTFSSKVYYKKGLSTFMRFWRNKTIREFNKVSVFAKDNLQSWNYFVRYKIVQNVWKNSSEKKSSKILLNADDGLTDLACQWLKHQRWKTEVDLRSVLFLLNYMMIFRWRCATKLYRSKSINIFKSSKTKPVLQGFKINNIRV